MSKHDEYLTEGHDILAGLLMIASILALIAAVIWWIWTRVIARAPAEFFWFFVGVIGVCTAWVVLSYVLGYLAVDARDDLQKWRNR